MVILIPACLSQATIILAPCFLAGLYAHRYAHLYAHLYEQFRALCDVNRDNTPYRVWSWSTCSTDHEYPVLIFSWRLQGITIDYWGLWTKVFQWCSHVCCIAHSWLPQGTIVVNSCNSGEQVEKTVPSACMHPFPAGKHFSRLGKQLPA